MLKYLELATSESCLNKAASTEPIFVLRANDPLFAQTIRLWAAMAHGTHEGEKINNALDFADVGAKWFEDRQPKTAASPLAEPYAAVRGRV